MTKLLVAGTNLFGQWQVGSCIIDVFQSKTVTHKNNLDPLELVHIGWSYNIFRSEDKFYVTGNWKGEENKFLNIKLPEECDKNISRTRFTMVGNDYSIILIDIINPTMWILDLDKDCYKKITFATEKPLNNLTERVKRHRKDDIIAKVTITNSSGLFLTEDGQVYWGLLPSLLDTSHCEGKVIDIQCGHEHFVLLTEAGKVYTWGNGRRLQLGHDSLISLELPTLVEALDGIEISKVRAGGWHTLALSKFGDLYAWGWNDIGQLGIKPTREQNSNPEESSENTFKSQPLPTLVDFYNNDDAVVTLNVKDIACGTRHSAALLEDDSLWTTGNNKYGQCGIQHESQVMVNHFKKVYQCETGYSLLGGPWTTVLVQL